MRARALARMAMLPPMMSGAAIARLIHEDPSRPPSRKAKIWRRFEPDRYMVMARPAASSEPTA